MSAPKPSAPTPHHHHAPVSARADGVDIERMIGQSGCASEYFALEECMGENDRVWSKCQAHVRALAACNRKAANKAKEPQ